MASVNFADDVVPQGQCDGLNIFFQLPNAPRPQRSLMLHMNGLMQKSGTDFTLYGNVITMMVAPSIGATLCAYYRY